LRKVRADESTGAPANHDEIARIVKETINALRGENGASDERVKRQRDDIIRALTAAKGRVGGADGAAVRMRMNRTTLLARMKKLGIDPRDYS
jgi:formate hydrogenlyase transcriptional activator